MKLAPAVRRFGVVGFWMAALSAAIAGEPGARVNAVADFLDRFAEAQVDNCPSCAVRKPATAGGVKQDALYQHPPAPGKAARITYPLELPTRQDGDLLLLSCDLAISDGVKLGANEDGVRFAVEVDGKTIFERNWKETKWCPAGVDLTPFAGQKVKLTFLTDARANSSYDWALWGSPKILHFRGRTGIETNRIPVSAGAIAIPVPAGLPLRLRVAPMGEGQPIEWEAPAVATEGPVRMALDFNFSRATGVELSWEPKEALSTGNIRVAAYPPQPAIVRFSSPQAVPGAGGLVPLEVEVRNAGRGKLLSGQNAVRIQVGSDTFPEIPLPDLAPGESWRNEWKWTAPGQGRRFATRAEVVTRDGQTVHAWNGQIRTFGDRNRQQAASTHLRLEFVNAGLDSAYSRVMAPNAGQWTQVAVWFPLARIILASDHGIVSWDVPLQEITRTVRRGIELPVRTLSSESVFDPDGVQWKVALRIDFDVERPVARLRYTWQPGRERKVLQFAGPNLYVGDGTVGAAKSSGLFPGLEYLYGAERSSNPRDFSPPLDDRRSPHPHKVTIPVMAVTIGENAQRSPDRSARFFAPDSLKDRAAFTSGGEVTHPDITVALMWNPLQKWDGEHQFPTPRFASPNFDEGMRNHRLGLFLPSAPDFVRENSELAERPFTIAAGQTVTLEATLLVAPGPATVAVREWLRDQGGLPKPNPWPRSFQDELDVCRAGFLKTIWDEKNEKWRHCIDWASGHAPGFAALLWMDSQVTERAEARRLSRERVELAATNMLREGGPASLISQANCHIMQWEFPFLYGYLPEAIAGLDGQIRHLIQSQRDDGGWVYEPGNAEQADLGQAGDSVLGTCANRAATLLRFARITGDTNALSAGEKALRFMEGFRVPRGGQTWECPMYEPDILAAAYAIKAYVDAYRVTGDPRWLHDAVYWAETGVPFIYLWTLPDKPMMLGATIPVFGSTFYSHTWLAVPVQWCGLVYAYHVWHLANELEKTPLGSTDSPLPLGLKFSPADWRTTVEHVTVSAMHQQFADGARIGAYPDSISQFEKRNPAFINPEDILINVLALKGYDPDVETARLKGAAGDIVVSSGAHISELRETGQSVQFQLRFFRGESSHTLVTAVKPREVKVNGQTLAPSTAPLRREPGWWWDEQRRRLYLTVSHKAAESVNVELMR